MTHTSETGAINRLHFSDAGFRRWFFNPCAAEMKISGIEHRQITTLHTTTSQHMIMSTIIIVQSQVVVYCHMHRIQQLSNWHTRRILSEICMTRTRYRCQNNWVDLSRQFLERVSLALCDNIVLWTRSSGGVLHIKIVCHNGSYILGQFSQPFDSVPQMVLFFSQAKLPIRGTEEICLVYPVICSKQWYVLSAVLYTLRYRDHRPMWLCVSCVWCIGALTSSDSVAPQRL